MIVSRLERGMNYLIAFLFTAFALAPIVIIVVTALIPSHGSEGGIGVFVQAWQEGNFSTYMANSSLVAIIVVSVATLCSIMAGFALGALQFRGASLVFALFLFGLMIPTDRKSTRLNSSHVAISYAVFCLKKKKTIMYRLLL